MIIDMSISLERLFSLIVNGELNVGNNKDLINVCFSIDETPYIKNKEHLKKLNAVRVFLTEPAIIIKRGIKNDLRKETKKRTVK